MKMTRACIIRFQVNFVYVTTTSGNTTTFDLLIIHRVAVLCLFLAFGFPILVSRAVLIASVSGHCLLKIIFFTAVKKCSKL